jgi:serine/threonine protein kinase
MTDLRGNARVTLMIHNKTGKLIVRKTISKKNKGLYQQLVHVRHENLVNMLSVEETESGCYTYEEYISGKTLTEVLADGPVPEETALRWIKQLCSAVRVLHEQNPVIIHRDIKPGNIMLTSDGVIKLIDFDAAKEFSSDKHRDTELIGTPDYAAPEQYGFAPSGPRTDIYAIGILFHELLTGYKPNEGKANYNGRYKHIIQNCIELDPGKRYRNIRELERQLRWRGIGRIIGKIPGFRTGVWWKILIASAAYISIAVFAFNAVYTNQDFLMMGRAVVTLGPLYLIIANPLQFRERMPLLRSKSKFLRALGFMLYLMIWSYLVSFFPE